MSTSCAPCIAADHWTPKSPHGEAGGTTWRDGAHPVAVRRLGGSRCTRWRFRPRPTPRPYRSLNPGMRLQRVVLAAMEPFYGLEMPAVEQQSRTSCFGDHTGSGGPAKDDQPESGSLLPARRAAPWIRPASASRVMCSSACKHLAPELTWASSTGGIRPRNSPVLGSFALQTSPRS